MIADLPTMPTRAGTRHSVVETVLLSSNGGELRYRVRSAELARGGHPDRLAFELSGLDPADPAGLLHSTSWRFDADRIVVTYAALPDPAPDHTVRPLAGSSLAVSVDPLAPSPDRIDAAAVVLHACRHLAYLHRTDPVVADRAASAPELWTVIATYTPALGGRLG